MLHNTAATQDVSFNNFLKKKNNQVRLTLFLLRPFQATNYKNAEQLEKIKLF